MTFIIYVSMKSIPSGDFLTSILQRKRVVSTAHDKRVSHRRERHISTSTPLLRMLKLSDHGAEHDAAFGHGFSMLEEGRLHMREHGRIGVVESQGAL